MGSREDAALGLLVGNELKGRAVLDVAGGGGAGVDCFLEQGDVPAVEEVAVAAVAGGVAVGEDEGLRIFVVGCPETGELVGLPKDLDEDGD